MYDITVKRAVSVLDGGGETTEYLLVGIPHGRNCLFRIWRGSKFEVFPEAYNESLYEAETRLDLLVSASSGEVHELDLSDRAVKLKADILLKWLKEHNHLNKPVGRSDIRIANLFWVYKGRQEDDPRILIHFFGEDCAWLGEFKISKDMGGWKNGAKVFPLCIWGKGQSTSEAFELITNYISFVGMNNYIYHELPDLTYTGLTTQAVGLLAKQAEFIWTPQEEQIGLSPSFIPEIQYRASKVYSVPFLWRDGQPTNGYGILAWNDEGTLEMVKSPL